MGSQSGARRARNGGRAGRPLLICLAAGALMSTLITAQNSAQSRGKGLTDVEGLKVGHFTLSERPTGCTVILADGDGAVGGVSQRGAAPGTRETDLLDPLNMVERVNAIVLTGGSAFGLDAAQGVVRYLEERNIGFKTAAGVVPIVPAAVIFDLGFGGDARVRPTAECGYRAAAAATNETVQEGNVGAGAGATVGKLGGFVEKPGVPRGRRQAMKAGVGSFSIRLANGLVVAAIVVVNAVGDIIDPPPGWWSRAHGDRMARSPTRAKFSAVRSRWPCPAPAKTPPLPSSPPTPGCARTR